MSIELNHSRHDIPMKESSSLLSATFKSNFLTCVPFCFHYTKRSFKIHKQMEFAEIILPRYFVMTKKSSFLRQLNLYGFNRFWYVPDPFMDFCSCPVDAVHFLSSHRNQTLSYSLLPFLSSGRDQGSYYHGACVLWSDAFFLSEGGLL